VTCKTMEKLKETIFLVSRRFDECEVPQRAVLGSGDDEFQFPAPKTVRFMTSSSATSSALPTLLTQHQDDIGPMELER